MRTITWTIRCGLHPVPDTYFNFQLEVARMPAGSVGLGAVHSDSIVETLDVIKHLRLGILSRRVDVALDSLLFQAAEERFSNCVVSTVSSAAHAGYQLVVLVPAVEVITTELGGFNWS